MRADHTQAVKIITEHPHLAWLPLTTQHPQQVKYNRLKLFRAGPFMEPTHTQTDEAIQIFTDGTCDRPQQQTAVRQHGQLFVRSIY